MRRRSIARSTNSGPHVDSPGVTSRDAIGVSVATITRLRSGGRMEVDGMLARVAWLGVPVETFVRESAQ